MAGQDALVKERTQLVRLLHDFATGRPVNEEDALAASGALRANIMEEGVPIDCSYQCGLPLPCRPVGTRGQG